ncbi:hypothetical protein GGR54DRAFT_3412 [Hypoxylon sp. NC1633]|nr:hypothetical protein GGR54DRAFT_3412 [Hypoxylon sp. NC1633]
MFDSLAYTRCQYHTRGRGCYVFCFVSNPCCSSVLGIIWYEYPMIIRIRHVLVGIYTYIIILYGPALLFLLSLLSLLSRNAPVARNHGIVAVIRHIAVQSPGVSYRNVFLIYQGAWVHKSPA